MDCAEYDVWMSSGGSKLLLVDAKRWLILLRMASLVDRGRVRRDRSNLFSVDNPESAIVRLWTEIYSSVQGSKKRVRLQLGPGGPPFG